ncbi:hypothetical protein V8E36_004032 [Tilletia maclaganii]
MNPSLLNSTAQSLVEEHRRRVENASSKSKKFIKFKNNQIIYIPERLLDQKLDINKAAFAALLSQRGCRLPAPRISTAPGTFQAIKDSIVAAFKTNSPPTDLNVNGIQFAQHISGSLVPVTLSEAFLNA